LRVIYVNKNFPDQCIERCEVLKYNFNCAFKNPTVLYEVSSDIAWTI